MSQKKNYSTKYVITNTTKKIIEREEDLEVVMCLEHVKHQRRIGCVLEVPEEGRVARTFTAQHVKQFDDEGKEKKKRGI